MNKLDIMLLKFFSFRTKSDTVRLFFPDWEKRNKVVDVFEKNGYLVKYVGKDREDIYSGIEINYKNKE